MSAHAGNTLKQAYAGGVTTTPATTPSTGRSDSARDLVGRWREMTSAHCRVSHELTVAVGVVGLSLVEFGVLDVLEERADGHLRMQDAAAVAALTTGATTRLVGRLESRGLLRRVICESDRRGIYTELTDEGRELLRRARPLHDSALRDALDHPAAATSIASAATAISQR